VGESAMTKIDDDIVNKLGDDDQTEISEINKEGGLFDLVSLSFSGTGAWITHYMYIIGFGAFFAAVYLGVNFVAATDLKTSLAYAVGINVCVLILVMVKILSWQNMQRLELLREIKRLEMRIMLLSR
jgi:hypothetical protein